MSSFGTVPLSEIWAMLDTCCAPHGYKKKQGQHNWIVTFRDKVFHRLPLGPHGKRTNPDIEVGHVKQMVKLFEILDCAKGHIERLR